MRSGAPAVVGLADLMQLVENSYDPEAIASEHGYCHYNCPLLSPLQL